MKVPAAPPVYRFSLLSNAEMLAKSRMPSRLKSAVA